MELASRIVSVLLGLVVAVFILWPITIPVGFGQAWWASKQIAAQPEPTPSPLPAALAEPAATPSPPSTPVASTAPSETPTQSAPAKPDEGKHALLAAERAEAERIAALNSKDAKNQKDAAPAAPTTPTKLYYRVTVRDAGTLQSGGTTIRLIGITARDADATCKDKKGRNWRCGAAGKSALARLIHTRAVSCELPKSGRRKDFPARCTVAGTDLSTWVVRQGWAVPADPAEPALAEAAEAAKKDGAGLWRAGDSTLTPEAKAQ
jgi:endonuclease YncB( thermonuclease family)